MQVAPWVSVVCKSRMLLQPIKKKILASPMNLTVPLFPLTSVVHIPKSRTQFFHVVEAGKFALGSTSKTLKISRLAQKEWIRVREIFHWEKNKRVPWRSEEERICPQWRKTMTDNHSPSIDIPANECSRLWFCSLSSVYRKTGGYWGFTLPLYFLRP